MKPVSLCLTLTLALAGAAPAQDAVSEAIVSVGFDCPEGECHVLPWFRGEGGFIGRIQPELDSVTYYAVCGDAGVSRSLMPDDVGIVTALFGPRSGLGCERDDGALQIHGLMDGGWYWVNDEENSAVSFLMPKAVLSNRKITPANPGWPGLTFTASGDRSVSFVREVASGRVGILPHLLPLPGAPQPPRCGHYKEGDGDDEVTRQRTNDCLLDAVYSVRVAMGPGTGPDSAIAGGQVFRPASGTTLLTLGLYGTGHLDASGGLGAGFDEPLAASWTITARVEGAAGVPRTIDADRALGVSADLNAGVVTVHNSADSDGTCAEQQPDYTVTLEIKATAGPNDVLPPVPGETGAGDFRPTAMLRVRCPSAAAATAGQELVPEGLSGGMERGGA